VLHSGESSSNINIFGAPCDVIPPFTRDELKDNYLGCQNLPTALWVMKFLDGSPRKTPRLAPIGVSQLFDKEDGSDRKEEGTDSSGAVEETVGKSSKISRENESYDLLDEDKYGPRES